MKPAGVPRWRCWKRAYGRRRDAVKIAKRTAGPQWVYRCPACSSFHVTSQPPHERPDARGY